METETIETPLEKWRTSQGLNVEEAARFLGISKSYVSMLESGDRKPSREKALDIETKTKGQVSFRDWQ